MPIVHGMLVPSFLGEFYRKLHANMRLAVSLTTWWYQTFGNSLNVSLTTVALSLSGFKMPAHIGSELRFVLHLQLYTFPPSSTHLHLHTLASADLHLHNLTSVDLLSLSLYISLSFYLSFFLIENIFLRNFLLNTYCIKLTSPSTTALCLFSYSELLDNHLFRSRANRRLVEVCSGEGK